jgi:hypothetical protein
MFAPINWQHLLEVNFQVVVKVGDYGRMTCGKQGPAFWRKNGTFSKEGNIFLNGKAKNTTFLIPSNMTVAKPQKGKHGLSLRTPNRSTCLLQLGGE